MKFFFTFTFHCKKTGGSELGGGGFLGGAGGGLTGRQPSASSGQPGAATSTQTGTVSKPI